MLNDIIIEALIIRGFSNDEIMDVLYGMFIMKDGDGGDIDKFLQDNGIVQLYNRRMGIKTVSNEPSEKFWYSLQGMDDEVMFFTKQIELAEDFDIMDKLKVEFPNKNIEKIEISPRSHQVVIIFNNSKSMAQSGLYGGINYKGKLYYYDLADCITGVMGKSEDGTQYIKINNIKYSLMFDSK